MSWRIDAHKITKGFYVKKKRRKVSVHCKSCEQMETSLSSYGLRLARFSRPLFSFYLQLMNYDTSSTGIFYCRIIILLCSVVGLLVSPRFPTTMIVVEVVGWEVQNLNRPLIYTDIDSIHSGLYNPEIDICSKISQIYFFRII